MTPAVTLNRDGHEWRPLDHGYDSLNRMTTIQDPRLITYITNTYTSAGMVYQQYLADGSSFYQFNWTMTSNTQNVTLGASASGPPSYQCVELSLLHNLQ